MTGRSESKSRWKGGRGCWKDEVRSRREYLRGGGTKGEREGERQRERKGRE